jgi:hypothetical protein
MSTEVARCVRSAIERHGLVGSGHIHLPPMGASRVLSGRYAEPDAVLIMTRVIIAPLDAMRNRLPSRTFAFRCARTFRT